MMKNHGCMKIVLGGIIFLALLIIGLNMGDMQDSAESMSRLRSQNGNTVAEAYYQDMGSFVEGFTGTMQALLILGGVTIGGSLMWSGISDIVQQGKKQGQTNQEETGNE